MTAQTLDNTLSTAGPPDLHPAHVPGWFPYDQASPCEHDLPADVVAVWAWFPADVLTDGSCPSAWDLYRATSWPGPHTGGRWSVAADVDYAHLVTCAEKLLGYPVALRPATSGLRTHDMPTDSWFECPIYLVSPQRGTTESAGTRPTREGPAA